MRLADVAWSGPGGGPVVLKVPSMIKAVSVKTYMVERWTQPLQPTAVEHH